MNRTVMAALLAIALVWPGGPWLGSDKVKHFLMSAFVQSTAFSAARAAGLSRNASHWAAGTASTMVGVGREVYDRRHGKRFSVADLFWDAAGAGTAAALLNHSR